MNRTDAKDICFCESRREILNNHADKFSTAEIALLHKTFRNWGEIAQQGSISSQTPASKTLKAAAEEDINLLLQQEELIKRFAEELPKQLWA